MDFSSFSRTFICLGSNNVMPSATPGVSHLAKIDVVGYREIGFTQIVRDSPSVVNIETDRVTHGGGCIMCKCSLDLFLLMGSLKVFHYLANSKLFLCIEKHVFKNFEICSELSCCSIDLS